MPASTPPSLHRLLSPTDADDAEEGWSSFLGEHSKLILHVAHRASSGHDEVMDRYTYVLDRLREDDFKRLRSFSLNGAGKFSTWLVVVVRRLCVDHHRARFGRAASDADSAGDPDLIARRNLVGPLAHDVDPDHLPGDAADGPEARLIRRERAERLSTVLAELASKDKLLLTLRYVDGHSPEKVARMLGYPSRFAVHRRLKSLVVLLRRKLEEHGVEP